MLEWQGHFDADLLDAFVASIGIQPTGGLVPLMSNRLGIVLEGNLDEPTMPLVRAFYDIPTQRFIRHEDIPTADTSPTDRIIRAEKAAYWFGEGWDDVRKAVAEGQLPTSTHKPARPYAATPNQRLSAQVTMTVGERD